MRVDPGRVLELLRAFNRAKTGAGRVQAALKPLDVAAAAARDARRAGDARGGRRGAVARDAVDAETGAVDDAKLAEAKELADALDVDEPTRLRTFEAAVRPFARLQVSLVSLLARATSRPEAPERSPLSLEGALLAMAPEEHELAMHPTPCRTRSCWQHVVHVVVTAAGRGARRAQLFEGEAAVTLAPRRHT